MASPDNNFPLSEKWQDEQIQAEDPSTKQQHQQQQQPLKKAENGDDTHAEHASQSDNSSQKDSPRVEKAGKRELTEDDCYEALGFCFPTWKKWTIISVIFIVQMSMNFNTGVYASAVTGMTEEFGDHDKLPILIHFHGGGFCISQPDWFMYNYIYSRITRTAQVICVSVYLRLAPENRLPAAIDDAFSGLLWLQSVAKRETNKPAWLADRADFDRVFLIGDSAGGNLVHQVAALAGEQELVPLRLAGGIPLHPGFVRSRRSKSETENPESPFLTLDMIDKMLGLALPVGCNKDHPITCPMGETAPPLDCVKLPPFLLCVAEKDLMVDTEIEYYEAMRKAKKEVELFVSRGVGHVFYLNSVAVETDADTAEQTGCLVAKIKEFIDSH